MATKNKAGGESKQPVSWYEKARADFAEVDSLSAACSVVWNGHHFHDFYQHYTTLSRVITKIVERRWWLTRSDSDALNDRQESLKFGSMAIARKTYQASFVHGAAESAALWGLYCPSDPFGVRITIPGWAIEEWVKGIRADQLYSCPHGKKEKSVCGTSIAEFKDIIYAAVNFRDVQKTRWGVNRANGLYWSEVNSQSGIKDLESEVRKAEYTGWLKDYEWRHERESRLCVRVDRCVPSMGLFVKVPGDLIRKMKFTFSPWLPREYESEVEGIIRSVLKIQTEVETEREDRRFRRSVLQGAMNLSRRKSVCQILEKCLKEESLAHAYVQEREAHHG